jgi:uncharacterized protein (UPF0332 family)
MIDEKIKKEAKNNFNNYLTEGLIKKEKNDTAKLMYIKNAEISLKLAQENIKSTLKPFRWVIVQSYYSMFYIANAVLLEIGYKTGSKIVHKVTSDALIVLIMDKMRDGLLEEYEELKENALEIASIKSENIISSFSMEKNKRSKFQYNVTESIQEKKANTSLIRAKEFLFEMKKLISEFNK